MKIKERENMLPRLDIRGALSLLSLCLVVTGMLLAVTACSSDDDDVILVLDDSSITGLYEDHYYVDLGLSVMWATCNVGADSPEDYGDYYAWGETEDKLVYTELNSLTYGKPMIDFFGNATYDAATANWGGRWRMPTEEELSELLTECTWKRATKAGVSGMNVTGPNGNSIFLPAAGGRYEASSYEAGSCGDYWGSTPSSSENSSASSLYFSAGDHHLHWDHRNLGHTVRPVFD